MSSQFFKLTAFGPLDLEFLIYLSNDDIKEFSIKLNELKTLKDCESFLKIKRIQDKMSLTSSSFIVNTLLFINRAFKFKTFIELITFTEPIFEEDEMFMKEILRLITEQNFLFLIPNNILDKECNLTLNIKMENGESEEGVVIHFGNKSHEIPTANPENTKSEDANENPSKSETTNKDSKPKIQSKKFTTNPFLSLSYDYSSCQYIFLDMNEMLSLKPYGIDVSFVHDFLESIQHLNTEIIMNYPNIIYNISLVDLKDIQYIADILTLTDVYIFEKKEALAYFNLLSSLTDEEKKTEDKNLELIFLKEVKKKRTMFPKIGLFMEDLNILSIMEQQVETNLVLFHTDFEFELYPSQNEQNPNLSTQELTKADEYKKNILVNYPYLKSVFFGAFLSRMIQKKSFNTACLAGSECVKKAIELIIKHKNFPTDLNYFVVKIKKPVNTGKSTVDPIQEQNRDREFRFQLDCININNSKMKKYNPLYDDNLISYFSSYPIRKQLKKVGFINKNGAILVDPDRNRLGKPKNKSLLKVFENEKEKLGIMKENNDKMKLQINNIFYRKDKSLKNVNLNELENLGKVKNFHPSSNRRLPALDFSWDKHPLAKKCGGMLYEQNIHEKKNLKPLSKDNYINLLNDFENKASQVVKSQSSHGVNISTNVEVGGISEGVTLSTKNKDYGKNKQSKELNKSKHEPKHEESIKEETISESNLKQETKEDGKRVKNPESTTNKANEDEKKATEEKEEADHPNVIS